MGESQYIAIYTSTGTIVISDQMVGYWMGMLRCYPMFRQSQAVQPISMFWVAIGHALVTPKSSWFMAEKNQKESVRRTELGQSISRSDRRFVGISIGDGFLRLNLRNPKPNLVGGIPTPLKNMTSSVGMMKFPIYGKKYIPICEGWTMQGSWFTPNIA